MGNRGSTSVFYAAHPTLKLDGRQEAGLSLGLLSLLVEETTAGLVRCEVSFGNWGSTGGGVGYLYFDRQLLEFGRTLTVEAGDGDAAGQLFEGRITGLEANFPPPGLPPEIVVLAEDRFQDLRMTRRTRTFEQFSDEDVINEIAAQHSLRADVDVDGPTYPFLAQVNQSDLAFLRARARAIDAEVWVEDDTLHAQARSRRNTGDLALTYKEGLREFSVLADLACQRTRLTVSGWDVTTKEGVAYEASETAIQSELNGFTSGPAVLQSALGDRAEYIVHTAPFNVQEAQYQAEAHFRRMARRFVTGQAMAEGDARIRVGARVEMNQLGPLFDGAYYVTEVRHTFDMQNGYRTAFSVERAGLGTQ